MIQGITFQGRLRGDFRRPDEYPGVHTVVREEHPIDILTSAIALVASGTNNIVLFDGWISFGQLLVYVGHGSYAQQANAG
jgi:hypothetical protein